MRNIPFSPPDITELEIQEVCEALRSGWITTGPRTKQLEKELAEYCHVAKLVCLNSATAAEEMNLRVLGIGEGDEMLVPALHLYRHGGGGHPCGGHGEVHRQPEGLAGDGLRSDGTGHHRQDQGGDPGGSGGHPLRL